VNLTKPRIQAGIEETLAFDEETGVLRVAWSARPNLNLGSALAYKLSAADAQVLAVALTAFASRGVG